MNLLAKTSNFLESYRGHDCTLSVIGYGLTMYSGLRERNNPFFAKKLLKLSSQLSNARVILRLLDDPSMLLYTLSYGFGKHEKNIILRSLSLIDNLASHAYYICEHVAWLADNSIIKVNSGFFWLMSLVAWMISLVTSVIRSELMSKRFIMIYLKLIEDISWIVNAIHWLPPGVLWSGKLSDFQSGFLGLISSICSLFRKINP